MDRGPARRTVVFAVALAVLLVAARSGSPAITLQAGLILFTIAATLWIRGGMQWAKGRISAMLLTQGWLGLVALAGIWLAAVTFFEDRRHAALRRSQTTPAPPRPALQDRKS